MNFLRVLGFIGWLLAFPAVAEPIVIMYVDVAAPINFTRQDLVEIFTMQKTKWTDGNTITVVTLHPRSWLHRQFMQRCLGVSSKVYEDSVKKSTRSTVRKHHVVVATPEEALFVVAVTPHAIGYTQRYLLFSDESNNSVRFFSQ